MWILKNFIISWWLFSKFLGQLFSRHLPVAVFLFSITVHNKLLIPPILSDQAQNPDSFLGMVCSTLSLSLCFVASLWKISVSLIHTHYVVYNTQPPRSFYFEQKYLKASTRQGRWDEFQIGGGAIEHWKVLSLNMAGWQKRFLILGALKWLK